MNDEIIAAMDEIEADESVGAVVVTGEPPAFCAGADLSQLGASQADGLKKIYEGFLRFGRCPLPTIAAVNGAAVGAGMNLALVCDVRIAAERARFDTRFLQLGLHPGGGHTWMFRRIAGPQATMAAVLLGEVMDGREAERVGLVHRCVADDDLLDTAIAMGARRRRGAPRPGHQDQGDHPRHGRHRRPRRGRRPRARAPGVVAEPAGIQGAPGRAAEEDLQQELIAVRAGQSVALSRR